MQKMKTTYIISMRQKWNLC